MKQFTWTGTITKMVTKTDYQEESTIQTCYKDALLRKQATKTCYFTIVTKTGYQDMLTRHVNRTY